MIWSFDVPQPASGRRLSIEYRVRKNFKILGSKGVHLPDGHFARIPHGEVLRRPSRRRTPLYCIRIFSQMGKLEISVLICRARTSQLFEKFPSNSELNAIDMS